MHLQVVIVGSSSCQISAPLGKSPLGTGTAQASAEELDHGAARPEAGATGRVGQRRHAGCRLELGHGAAAVAHQEHGLALMLAVAAGDKGVAALDLVNEAVGGEKIERAR
jgi:hypothetical protein